MIIKCKSCKSIFDIPDNKIGSNGRIVKCGFCDHEWFQNNISADIPLPEKSQEEKGVTLKAKKNKSLILLNFFILLIVLFIGILSNQGIILAKYPKLIGFFESADILKEIIIQNTNWIKEIFQDMFR